MLASAARGRRGARRGAVARSRGAAGMQALAERGVLRRIPRAALVTRLASDDRMQMFRALVTRLARRRICRAPRASRSRRLRTGSPPSQARSCVSRTRYRRSTRALGAGTPPPRDLPIWRVGRARRDGAAYRWAIRAIMGAHAAVDRRHRSPRLDRVPRVRRGVRSGGDPGPSCRRVAGRQSKKVIPRKWRRFCGSR